MTSRIAEKHKLSLAQHLKAIREHTIEPRAEYVVDMTCKTAAQA